MPDILIYNTAEKPLTDLGHTRVTVYSTGDVFLSRPGLVTSSCTMNLDLYPYDTQDCSLTFGSWSYTDAKLNLSAFDPAIDTAVFIEDSEWTLVEVDAVRTATAYGTDVYPDVTFSMKLKRIVRYYGECSHYMVHHYSFIVLRNDDHCSCHCLSARYCHGLPHSVQVGGADHLHSDHHAVSVSLPTAPCFIVAAHGQPSSHLATFAGLSPIRCDGCRVQHCKCERVSSRGLSSQV